MPLKIEFTCPWCAIDPASQESALQQVGEEVPDAHHLLTWAELGGRKQHALKKAMLVGLGHFALRHYWLAQRSDGRVGQISIGADTQAAH